MKIKCFLEEEGKHLYVKRSIRLKPTWLFPERPEADRPMNGKHTTPLQTLEGSKFKTLPGQRVVKSLRWSFNLRSAIVFGWLGVSQERKAGESGAGYRRG